MRGEEGEERDGPVCGAGEAVRARAVGGRLDVVPLGPLVGAVHCAQEGKRVSGCRGEEEERARKGNALVTKSLAVRNLAQTLGCGPVTVSKRSLGRFAGLTDDIVLSDRGRRRRGGRGGWAGVAVDCASAVCGGPCVQALCVLAADEEEGGGGGGGSEARASFSSWLSSAADQRRAGTTKSCKCE